MVPIWELRLFDQNGYRVATLNEWPEFEVEIPVNGFCSYGLRLHGNDSNVALFTADGLLEGWWCDPENEIEWHREFCAWTEDTRRWTDSEGVRHFQSSGRGLEAMLAWNIIDTYAGSAASRKSGAGETVLKAYVDEQAGPGAGARARDGLVVETDAGQGAFWSGQRSNRELLTVCQEIAEVTGLQFGIERTDRYEFEFRVWVPTDRRTTVIFAEARGNMLEPEIVETRSAVANWIKVGADDEGAAREIEYVQDMASIALTPQGRRERFINAAGNTGAELIARGEQELTENRKRVSLSFTVAQSPGCLYAKHYFLGDYVTAVYDGVTYAHRIDRVRWRITADGARLEVSAIGITDESGS